MSEKVITEAELCRKHGFILAPGGEPDPKALALVGEAAMIGLVACHQWAHTARHWLDRAEALEAELADCRRMGAECARQVEILQKIYVVESYHDNDCGVFSDLDKAMNRANGDASAEVVVELQLKDGSFDPTDRDWYKCGECNQFKENYRNYYQPGVITGIVCDECAAQIPGVDRATE